MEKRLKQACFMSFCLGLALVSASVIFDVLIEKNSANSLKYLLIIIGSFFKSLGIGCFVNIILSIIKLWVESTKTLAENGLIEYMKEEEKQELRKQLTNDLIKQNGHNKEDNFYAFFEKEVASLLTGCYYDYFRIYITCNVTENFIQKSITTNVKLINPTAKRISDSIPFRYDLQEVKSVEIDDLYIIDKFDVDGIDEKDTLLKSKQTHDLRGETNDAYCIKINLKYNCNIKNSCTIEMKTRTIVPLNDVNYSNKITKPCKDYTINFVLQNPLYELSWHNFGYMGNNKEKIIEQEHENTLNVGFRGWILPDNGIVISINKK